MSSPVPIQEEITRGVKITSDPWIRFFNNLQTFLDQDAKTSSAFTKVKATAIKVIGAATGTAALEGAQTANLVLALTEILASGSYTPTLSSTVNLSTSSPGLCIYLQVGNVVTVQGQVATGLTSGSAATSFQMTLPITTTAAFSTSLTGSGVIKGSGNSTATAVASLVPGGTPRASIAWTGNSSVDGAPLLFSFSYLVA
jgi:hypothetical protein